jgi:drug/metabolite transporter (DMT)-like permease
MPSRLKTASTSMAAQFIALALVWGSSFLFIKIGLEGATPVQVVLARMVFGSLVLTAIMALTRRNLPRDPRLWAHLSVVAMLLCVVPFLLFAWAEQTIPSGLASIYNATTPLLTMLVAVTLLPTERLTPARAAGLALGFAGVLVVLGPWRGLGAAGGLLAQAACLAATTCYGIALVHLRRHLTGRGLDAVTIAFCQVTIGAVVMLLIAPFAATDPVTLTPRVVVGLVLLGTLGTGLAYVWNTNVVAGWGPTNASTVTYLTPLVGVVLGVLVLDESVTWNQPVGAVLVIAGILVTQGRVGAIHRRRSRSDSR